MKCAAHAFATLGHPGRLAVYRLLMRFAPQGVRPTEIAAALGLRQNTLSHHLAELSASGLVGVEHRGRSRHYFVDLDTAEGVLAYLALDVGRARPDLLASLACVGQGTGERRARRRGNGLNVLFICSANTARSILAEALLRDLGKGRFRAFSAGTQPHARLNPLALEILDSHGHETASLRSSHVSRYQRQNAIEMDIVLTVCDAAAAQDCPPWPGQPISGHWGLPDPATARGTHAERMQAFARSYGALRRRISALVALPFNTLNRLSLQSSVDAIGIDMLSKG